MSALPQERAAAAAQPLDIPALYEAYVATFATKDPEQIVKLHAPEGSFWLHAAGAPAVGRDAIAKTFAGFFAQWPAFGFEVKRVVFADRHWVLDWVVTAVLPLPGGPTPIRFDALDIIDVDENGLVARKDTWVDSAQLRAQLPA